MPSLMPGTPGTKEAYGLSVVGNDGTVRIPPRAFAHYDFRADALAVAVTTHRGEAGFALLNKSRADASVFRKFVDRLDAPDAVHWFSHRAYALLLVGSGSVRLAPDLLDAFHLRPGDRLMSVKSTTVALSFTPVENWRAKFARRGLHAAAAAIDRLEVF
ncbi:MAG: hypothetical protein GX548_09425 [Lentisphaerae bacterium]|nr:hypothetical protein [Lentisphaerota bacterium]